MARLESTPLARTKPCFLLIHQRGVSDVALLAPRLQCCELALPSILAIPHLSDHPLAWPCATEATERMIKYASIVSNPGSTPLFVVFILCRTVDHVSHLSCQPNTSVWYSAWVPCGCISTSQDGAKGAFVFVTLSGRVSLQRACLCVELSCFSCPLVYVIDGTTCCTTRAEN